MVGFLLVSVAYAILDGCGDEVDINTACVMRTPPITCGTYSIWNGTGNITHDGITMQEIPVGTGIYNFTFNANGSGIHTIVLCDNTSTNINVEVTDQTDLATIQTDITTILTNTVTLSSEHTTLNQSILTNITATGFAVSVWNYASSIATNILNLIANSTFSFIMQNATTVPTVNGSNVLIYETVDYGDNVIVNTTFEYNMSAFELLNSTRILIP